MTSLGRPIAVIGAGFSGSLLAVHLLRRSLSEDRIYLIERSAEFGRGLAYATGNPRHLLNVRAGNMSAFSDQPEHFLDWVRGLPEEERHGISMTADWLTFVSRWLYGSYIQHILAQEIWGEGRANRLHLVADEAVALHPTARGYRLEVGSGRSYEVDAVALAMGNFPPGGAIPGYVANPWGPDAVTYLDPDASVLLVGTGLTMVDVVISLLDRGHRGEICAISRRGLLPRTHAAVAPAPRFLPPAPAPRRALALLRALRAEIRRAEAEGRDWRSVIDSLRPDTQDLWRNLPLEEKRRFLRHLRPWWDVHRHRMAPAVATRIAQARERGQLTIQRARLGSVGTGRPVLGEPGLEVVLLPAGGGEPTTVSVALGTSLGHVAHRGAPHPRLARYGPSPRRCPRPRTRRHRPRRGRRLPRPAFGDSLRRGADHQGHLLGDYRGPGYPPPVRAAG
jgi:uncharacterized NAD(P)/FAD-binding protein YdhS